MDIQEIPTKIYIYRQTSSAIREIVTAVVMLALGIATGLWLVFPNLLAVLDSGGANLLQHVGNLLIYIVIMALFLWMVFRHWRSASAAADLASQGVDTQAEVLEIWGKEGRISNEFWIAYRYYETYEGKAEVKKKYAIGLKPGDMIQVRMLERDPHIHRVLLLDESRFKNDKKADYIEREGS